tara:strand:- start:634 stop:1077 length:444 start_codon:yes stop_codon:yes gene_type:complete
VKKKFPATSKDKNDWIAFTKQMDNVSPKESDLPKENIGIGKVQKLDLHGYSLDEANKMVKKFITKSFNSGYKKLLIVTGKGSRSKSYNNPYLSEKFSVLKYAVPEYIKNDQNLNHKISRISKASLQDGGEGAIYIFLKNNKNLQDEF